MKDLFIGVNRDKDISKFNKKQIRKCEKKKFCDFCGINIESDHNFHQKGSELYASCSICYYTENLDEIVAMKKGSIILMPEMTQVELNAMLRLIWYYESIEEEDMIDKIDTIGNLYSQIRERENFVESYYSEGASDIDIVINSLYNFKKERYEKRDVGMYGLLWMPEKDIFFQTSTYMEYRVISKIST